MAQTWRLNADFTVWTFSTVTNSCLYGLVSCALCPFLLRQEVAYAIRRCQDSTGMEQGAEYVVQEILALEVWEGAASFVSEFYSIHEDFGPDQCN